MSRIATSTLALTLAGVALFIPPGTLAEHLIGGGDRYLPSVIVGFWLLKLILLVAAGLIWLLPSHLAGTGGIGPVADRGIITGIKWTRSDIFLVLVLVIVSAGLRLISLNEGLWFDEILTLIRYVRLPTGQILTHYDSQNHHILYTLLAHGSVAIFGESAWAIRLPSALLGVLSIPVIYLFGRQIAPRNEAFLAAAFLTVSYHHVWFSQNARGYVGLLVGSVLASSLLLKLLASGRIRPGMVLAYAAVAALTVWIHFTGAVIVVAHGIIWLLITQAPPHLRIPPAKLTILLALVLATLFSMALYGPVLLQLTDTLFGGQTLSKTTEWKKPSWFVLETLRNLYNVAPGGWPAIVMGAFIFLIGARSYARQSWLILGVLLIPALLVAVVILGAGHSLWPRLFFFSAGFVVLIAVRGGATIVAWKVPPAQASRWVMTLGMVVVLFSTTTIHLAWKPKQDYESTLQFLEITTDPADAIVAADLINTPLKRYYGRDMVVIDSPEKLSAVESAHPRTWVLYTFPVSLAAKHPGVWAKLETEYRTAAVFPGTTGGGDIVVLVKP